MISLSKWFLTWARSSLRSSMSHFHAVGGLIHPTGMIHAVTLCLAGLCTNTVYSHENIF